MSECLWLRDLRCKVRARLRAQGATQAGLAWHLGISEKHVSQLLTGKVAGSPEMLERIAAAAGLRIALTDADGPVPVLPRRRPGTGWRGAPRKDGKFAATREAA